MITNLKYFENDFSDLLNLLTEFKNEIQFIKKCRINDFSKENITEIFNDIFRSFPYEIETSSSDLGFSYYTIEIFDLYFEISEYDGKIDLERIERSKRRFNKTELDTQDKYLISDIIENYFHSLIYNYNIFLSNAKKYPFFTEIENEEIILKNLYNLYKGVLNDETKQINLFWGINLTKEISNKILKMLCDFIEQRLLVLNPQINTSSLSNKLSYNLNKQNKIQWLGTQQELGELFYELIQKGWVPEIPYGERKKFANSITELFDIEITKRTKSSNTQDSFYQQFKGEVINGKWNLSFFESKKYERKFKQIKSNS